MLLLSIHEVVALVRPPLLLHFHLKERIPGSTQKVANELTTLYLSENLRERKDKSKETYVF